MFYVKNGSMYLMELDEENKRADWTAFRDLAHGFKSKSTAERTARKVRNGWGLYVSKE